MVRLLKRPGKWAVLLRVASGWLSACRLNEGVVWMVCTARAAGSIESCRKESMQLKRGCNHGHAQLMRVVLGSPCAF